MRYFAKFHDGTQTKNKAQVQAYAFMKKFASILITSDEALEKMVADMKEGIERINAAYPRCSNIDFTTRLHDDYRGKCLFVGDICSYSFYSVLSEFSVLEKEPEQTKEEIHNTESSKSFEL